MGKISKLTYKASLILAQALTLFLFGGVLFESSALADPPVFRMAISPRVAQEGSVVTIGILIGGGGSQISQCSLTVYGQASDCLSSHQVRARYPRLEAYATIEGDGWSRVAYDSIQVTKSIPLPSPPSPGYIKWTYGYQQLFEDPTDVEFLRRFRDEFLVGNKKGKLYTDLLYENSEQALQVLLDNPDLILRAKELIEANQEGILEVLNGREAVVNNPGGIITFLDRFAAKSPATLKVLARMVKKDMLRKFRQGKPFIGFIP